MFGRALIADTVLVRDGRALCAIVVPDDASETVRYAADQLAQYLKKMSATDVPVVAESKFSAPVRIDVGPTAASRSVVSDNTKRTPESVFIRCDDKTVVICGGSDRGTLFAVYRFLEKFLDCRWLAPAGHEYVPARKTLSVPVTSYATAPAFNVRSFISHRDAELMDWGVKVGLNGFYTAAAAPSNGGCYYLPAELPGCHTWYRVIPGKVYFDKHPEWFAMIDGKRRPGAVHGEQLCVTAPGLADEFAKNIIAIFDKDPGCRITSISPNDGYGWCECESCEALDRKLCGARMTKQGLAGDRRFRGDRVFWFANEVARRVAKKHPDKMLLVLAYVNYAEPPDTVRPLPNVVPWLCHYAPADYSRPIADATSGPNRQFNELLKGWAKVAPHLLFYSYVSKSMWWQLPRPVTRSFAADVKHLHSLGIGRYYAQSSLSDWPLDGPLYYVLAKLLWDPSGNPEAIADDWTRHMFGQAAPAMSQFYALVERSVRKTGKSYSDNPLRDVPGLYSMAELTRARKALGDAAELADDDLYRNRIKQVTKKFEYGFYMIQALEAYDRFKQDGAPEAAQKAREYGTRALTVHRVSQAERFVESIRVFSELGVLARGFGQVEDLGGRRCWNSDETGPGDGRAGWASFFIRVADLTRPIKIEMDVWGKSQLGSIVINTGGKGKGSSSGGNWTPITPNQPLSGEAKWETLVFRIPAKAFAAGKKVQHIGFGGGDSQVWIANIRMVSAEQ